MDKISVTVCVLLLSGMVCVEASALQPVHLRPDCAYVFNPYNGNPPGLDGQAEQIILVLQMAGLSIPVSSWADADLETVAGEIVGDGLPDSYQMAIVGAALCAGDPQITNEYGHNLAEFNALMEEIASFAAIAVSFSGDAAATADDLTAWADTLPDGQIKWDALYLADLLDWTVGRLSENVLPYASLVTGVLPTYAPFFSSLAGLNSGTRATIDDLLSTAIGYLTSYCTIGSMESEVGLLAELAQPPMDPDLAERCLALRDAIASAIPVVEGLRVPDWDIFGTSLKAPNEPLAADGDYNHDSLTNAQVYDLVTAGGGNRFDFVRAAASNDPFWPGQPGLPAAGPIGLAMLVLALGPLAIRRLRRNS